MSANDVLVAVGRIYVAKQALAVIEPDIHPMTLAEISLGASVVAEVESQLGHSLVADLRDYYLQLDEWNGVNVSMSILSVRSLVAGPDFDEGQRRLAAISDETLQLAGGRRNEFLVIAMIRDLTDVYLLHTSMGQVAWVAGEELVDVYPTFPDMLHATAEYLERDLAAARSDA